MLSEVLRQSLQLGQVRLDPLLVPVDTGRGGQATAHYGGSTGAANGSCDVSVGEGGTLGGQTVEAGCVFLARVSVQEPDPIVHIVDRHEQHI